MSPSERNARRRLSLALLSLGSVVVALVVAEVVLRALDLPRADKWLPGGDNTEGEFLVDPDLFWRLAPEGHQYFVNAHGLRGPWPRPDRHPNELRIVCIGDSCTFGTGVRIDQTYGHRLEDKLQDRLPGRYVSATLLALPGYSTLQNRLLVERHAEDLRPDVSVLYCGAWNDFVPAMGLRDSERRSGSSLRLARLLNRVFNGGASAFDYREEFRAGRAPDGRRVELEEFRDNLRTMIELLQKVGSRVIVVLPPEPAQMLRRFSISKNYRGIVREFAGADDVAFLDGQKLFESFVEKVPQDWREDEVGRSIVFRDWIHPAALGHELLARAILELLPPELSRWRVGAKGASGPRLGKPVPDKIPHGESTTVGIPLFKSVSVERVWLGKYVLRCFESEPGQLVLTVPEDLPPGSYPIQIATGDGWFDTQETVTVEAPSIEVSLARNDEATELRADVPGPPGAVVILWIARARRPEPMTTRYGAIGLQFGEGGRPPGRPDLPFYFRKLPLPSFHARIGKDGVARLRKTFAAPDGPQPDTVYFQALVYEGGRETPGFLTRVVPVSVPR